MDEWDDGQVCKLWEGIYQANWQKGLARLKKISGVVLGFHSVIDGVKHVKSTELERLLHLNEIVTNSFERSIGFPDEIRSPDDFLACLLASMQKGKAMQRMIRNAATFQWLLDELGYDFPRLGGTSGNMSSALTPLGVKILVYASPLTTDLAELFVQADNLNVLVEEDGRPVLKTPRAAASRPGIEAIHWIFEYPEGLTIRVGARQFTTPRANRFIASWNPVNNQLRIDPSFKRGLLQLAGEFSHFIVSGFHILSEIYPDGTTYKECLLPVAEYLADLKRKNPGLRVHAEFASIGSARIRQGVVDWILPETDSLGLNEVELAALVRDANCPALAGRLESAESITDVLEASYLVTCRSGLSRIHLHNLGYYLCLVRPGYARDADACESARIGYHDGIRENGGRSRGRRDTILSGLIAAATLAASRTTRGFVSSNDDEIGANLEHPISVRGLAALRELDNYLAAQGELVETGVTRYKEYDLALVPAKVVARPVLTVGLGDLISSSAFLAMG